MKIGLFGYGIIGSVWARHYELAGVLGGCWNRSEKHAAPGWTPEASTLAEQCEVLHLVVSDPQAVESVLTQIEGALGAGKLVIQSSTIDPESARRFSERVKAAGSRYVEAPFSGSRPAAEARKVMFLLGGDAADVEVADKCLAAVSENRVAVGTVEQAAAIKLALNIQVAVHVEALCESVALTRRAGVDDGKYFDVLRRSALWTPLAAMKEPKLRASDFSAQFSVKHMLKDIRLAKTTGPDSVLPAAASVGDRLEALVGSGKGEEDFCALIRGLGPDKSGA